ncbi:MAG TPA: hypothetical protein VLF89_09140 [Candidatus Saccharimonadales bacterium]|nr:hypothetical protein [Candidatus Saccharimonadales bacterium]
MRTFTPSFAKIASSPAIAILLVLVFYLLFVFLISFDNSFDDNLLPVLGGTLVVLALVLAYFISCLVWEYGKNHRRILIVIFTFLTTIGSFFICGLLMSYFSLCITDLGLPCLAGHPCPPPPQCPETQIAKNLSYVGIGIPLMSILFGILAFRKEGRTGSNKAK